MVRVLAWTARGAGLSSVLLLSLHMIALKRENLILSKLILTDHEYSYSRQSRHTGITTNTSNYHLSTNRVRAQFDSTLQGHLKALTKFTRGIERAKHHSQLLQRASDTKRPPRELIPKVSPKIPHTPGSFTFELGNSLQEAGLVLTKNLQDYWTNRVTRLEVEYSLIYNNLKSLSIQEQWNTIEDILEQTAREPQLELKRKKTRQTNPQPTPQHQQPPQKKHHNHRFKEPKPPITNLSSYTLTKHQISLLSRGHNFIPTLIRDHSANIVQDILLFDRN